jgi:DNA repair protein RadC
LAATVLKAFDSDLIDLFTAIIHELTQVKSIGFAKACQIKVIFEMANRIESFFGEYRPKIETKEDVVKLLAPYMRYLKQVEFRVILLDDKQRLIRHYRVSLGSLDSALVRPREVFRPAVTAGAKSIIIVHNHPSGDPEPSDEDIQQTRRLGMCGVIVDIDVVDYVIIGFSEHVSMKERELL